jgi:hypothetical protein
MFSVISKLSIVSVIILASCATTPSAVVVERADELSSAPEWTSLTKPTAPAPGVVQFLGYVEVPGESLKSAAINMADEKAMTEPTRSLVEAFLDQNQVGEELRSDGSFGRRVISATSGYRPPMTSLRITRRYYEVVVVKTGLTAGETRLRVWSLAEADKSDYEAAKRAYIRHLAGIPEVKKLLDDVGQRQINQVTKQQVAGAE